MPALVSLLALFSQSFNSINIYFQELVTSFQKYNYLKAPTETAFTPQNNLAVNLDRQILYNHSHSSLFGDDVSTEQKMMVEAIGRHLVYGESEKLFLICLFVFIRDSMRLCV